VLLLLLLLLPPVQRCGTVCLYSFGNRTSPSDNLNDRLKRLCLVSRVAAPCAWTLRVLTRNLLTYLLTYFESQEGLENCRPLVGKSTKCAVFQCWQGLNCPVVCALAFFVVSNTKNKSMWLSLETETASLSSVYRQTAACLLSTDRQLPVLCLQTDSCLSCVYRQTAACLLSTDRQLPVFCLQTDSCLSSVYRQRAAHHVLRVSTADYSSV